MASQNSGCSRSSRRNSSAQRRMLVCDHGQPPVLRVSGTKENPGRRFWRCVYSTVRGNNCGNNSLDPLQEPMSLA
ncbi:hypothetical protein PIB30_080416 [Stylosanthes scabra]|uniref:Zinc finger GRF-type domain-containing protein n=1 Tax=Stylosanthes scabra TaxID=79078 RepID=A0ABU6VUY7_9FABA|nr:hypothetical protein [Stylosanthes scabra]